MIVSGAIRRYKLYHRQVKVPDNGGKRGIRGQAVDRDRSIRQAVSRAREKIYGYVIANDWEYWATQTFSPEKLDRYSLDDIVKTYGKKLRNLKARKYPDLRWLIVPEQHKDGAWHLHMLVAGVPREAIVYSGRNYYNGDYVRPIYNWVDTIDYGYNDYVYIGDCDVLERLKIAGYLSKYITKALAADRYNKKMYWCSRGLNIPTITNTIIDNIDYIGAAGVIISRYTYHINDPDTGEIYNTVDDITVYKPIGE